MNVSPKMIRDFKKQDIPAAYIDAVLKDFKSLKISKKASQGVLDGMFAIFLTGNLNAVDLDTKFGHMMSPFVGTHYERNGTRSRTKSTK